MIRVKDQLGNDIPGVYRNSAGTIVIKNESALEENRRIHKVAKLETEVQELSKLVQTLLNNQKRNING